jgi:hypothetical protein
MANRKRAPKDVEARHRAILARAAAKMVAKRDEAWKAELDLREKVRAAFAEGVTVGPIKEATGLSTPRLYQVKHQDPNEERKGKTA